MSSWFLKLAALYFLLGNLVGMTMSMTHNFSLVGFHAHVNLLGWVSMAVFALIYKTFPDLESSTLFRWHFWLYNVGFLVMMPALLALLLGVGWVEPFIGVGATTLIIGVLLFVINVWKTVD